MPERPAHLRQGVGKGWAYFPVPGALAHGALPAGLALDHQRHQGKEPEPKGRGALHRQVVPLALAIEAKVSAGLLKGGFHGESVARRTPRSGEWISPGRSRAVPEVQTAPSGRARVP